jgi:hypothetical protein
MCVNNAYHAHNLSQTVSDLLSEECKSFKDFQKMRARQLPFRQFCLELANNLKIEVIPPTMHESGRDDVERGHSCPSVAITYNKREAYFSKPHLIEWRMNQRVLHQPSSAQRQSSCVWCCRIDHSTGERHTRHGRKRAWMCSTCDVPLCKRPRFNGRSCFPLFHEAKTLFDPCCAKAQSIQVSVRSHGNRRAPPSRRTDLSAGAVEGLIVPPSASRNDIDDDDYIPGNSSGDDDDKSSPERPASCCWTCSTITIPERRTRWSHLM